MKGLVLKETVGLALCWGLEGVKFKKKIINHELIKSIFYHKKYPKYFYDGQVALLLVYQLMINKV